MIRPPEGRNIAQGGGTDQSHQLGDNIPSDQLGAAIFLGALSGQPPPFRATNRPHMLVGLPDFPATDANCNATLTQTDGYTPSPAMPHLAKIYLFVDVVETSFSLQGSYGQAQTSRSFYPHSFIQHEWTIEGQMANQYEFDKLVEFVEWHQQRALYSDSPPPVDGPNQVRGAIFKLFKPANTKEADFNMIRGLNPQITGKDPSEAPRRGIAPPQNGPGSVMVVVVITHMEAGHERFRFAPAFTLTCQVLYDYWADSLNADPLLHQSFSWSSVVGDVNSPAPLNDIAPINQPGAQFNPPEPRSGV